MPSRTHLIEHCLLAARSSEISTLDQLAQGCHLVAAVCELVHELQRERGISNIYLASGGQRFVSELEAQRVRSDHAHEHFDAYLQRVQQGEERLWSSARLYHRIARVLLQLDDLRELRRSIDRRRLDSAAATEAWCRLIADLLAILFEIADIAADPQISRALVALFHFLQAKEHAGQERAWGCVGFAAECFDAELQARLLHLRELQQRALEVFERFADPAEQTLWQQLQASPETDELQRLRQVIDGFGDNRRVPAGISEIWFAVASARIDAMREVEEQLSAALLAMARDRQARAHQTLQDNRSRLQSDPGSASVSAFSLLLDNVTERAASLSSAGALRALYDLLQEQAEHLQQMSDQLDEARAALTERKQVERAKGLLMRYQGLSEEEAFATLRRSAMEGNCRLAEVAGRVIAAAERLQG